jgi:hypothetical protein
MTDAELFAVAMQQYGGRVAFERRAGTLAGTAYSSMHASARSLIDDAMRMLPGLPQIHFDFVATGAVNAFAFKHDGRYFIGVTSGAFFMLCLVFSRMLCSRTLLTHIGNPNLEDDPVSRFPEFIPDANQMTQRGMLPIPPKCDLRKRYVSHLVDRAMIFLVGHELAHIAHGHVDYLQANYGTGFIGEVGWRQRDEKATFERQALEVDADERSVIAGMSTIQLLLAGDTALIPGWSRSPIEGKDLLFDWGFAVNSLFRLFGDVRFTGEDLPTTSHPPLPLRRMIVTMMADFVTRSQWSEDFAETARKTLRRSMLEAELAFMQIMGQEHGAAGLMDASAQASQTHANALARFLDGPLRERLSPYAYEHAPPDPPRARPAGR